MLEKREDVSLYEERLEIVITENFDNKHELFDWQILEDVFQVQVLGEKSFRATSLVNNAKFLARACLAMKNKSIFITSQPHTHNIITCA